MAHNLKLRIIARCVRGPLIQLAGNSIHKKKSLTPVYCIEPLCGWRPQQSRSPALLSNQTGDVRIAPDRHLELFISSPLYYYD